MAMVAARRQPLACDWSSIMACDIPNATCGFRAFDGSNRWFKRLGIYDFDCCFLPDGRTTNPGISSPDDGYCILEKEQATCGCCPTGKCVVLESVRYYALLFPVGQVVPCVTVGCSSAHQPITATKCSLGADQFCCNADGANLYAELTDEISPLP